MSVTLPSTWWIAPSSIQLCAAPLWCCGLAVIDCMWTQSGSDGWERVVYQPCSCLCDHISNLFIMALRRVCHWGDMIQSKWHCWGSAALLLKEHFTNNLCGQPVCAGGLALWDQHPPPQYLHPTVFTFSHQCAVHVRCAVLNQVCLPGYMPLITSGFISACLTHVQTQSP